jgi:hypothetical protein
LGTQTSVGFLTVVGEGNDGEKKQCEADPFGC